MVDGSMNNKNTLLIENSKAITHIRQQYHQGRLTPIFGAGISISLGFPNWDELIEGIAHNSEIDGSEIHTSARVWSSSTATTQLIFQNFKKKRLDSLKAHSSMAYKEKKVLSEWREAVHETLYKESKINRIGKIKSHPYILKLLPIIEKSDLTVNYNFDDTFEYIIANKELNQEENSVQGKPYQAVWNAHVQFRSDAVVIYHPNGYLPEDRNLRQSEELVFSEDSFSDQLIGSMSGRLSTLTHILTKKTCLFTGLSLNDSTLKHLLRQAASISPGNYHYFIRYTSNDDTLTTDEKRAIYNSNFDVYNLITLFLNDSGIASLAELITMTSEDYCHLSEIQGVDSKYVYYLTGTVGTGKSTILTHFGNISSYEEWIDERPSELSIPFSELDSEMRAMLDSWIDTQFYKKNLKLTKAEEGIFIVDRCPIDPITFVKEEAEMACRAKSMIKAISPGKSGMKIQNGQVLLLKSNPDEIVTRLLSKRNSSWTTKDISALHTRTLKIFNENDVTLIDNSGRNLENVVKDVARVIFTEKYEPINLHYKLDSID
jgi:hypothetical protein